MLCGCIPDTTPYIPHPTSYILHHPGGLSMRRAKRLDAIPPYLFGEIARLKAKAIAEGRDLVDFGIGDPDVPTPPVSYTHLTLPTNREV